MSETPFIGSTVSIYYKGGPKGENPIDICISGEPLKFMIGSLSVPAPIESVLTEMKRGEERTIDITAEEGFGRYEDRYTEWYPRIMLPGGDDLAVGSVLMWQPEDGGKKVPARVVEETDDLVKIDLNHPMAGKEVSYWIKLLDFE